MLSTSQRPPGERFKYHVPPKPAPPPAPRARQAQPTQPVEHVHARETGAHHHGVEHQASSWTGTTYGPSGTNATGGSEWRAMLSATAPARSVTRSTPVSPAVIASSPSV